LSAETHTFLFADLAGYTALTEAMGDDSAADVAAEFCDHVRGLLAAHDAEEIKVIGDAVMLRVPDAVAAARLAARIVGDYGARHRALGVGVGIHTGTAVRRGDDWFGAAVNVASRVADVAEAGEILLTEATHAATGGVIAVQSRGRRSFKHVGEPIALYALVFDQGDAPPALPVDPVCRMAVDPQLASESVAHRGVEYHFCSAECAKAFAAAPGRYVPAR
jgi:class 3 adenylate cyclase/YHS domain-containing protein